MFSDPIDLAGFEQDNAKYDTENVGPALQA
jgi:hypothetical protein